MFEKFTGLEYLRMEIACAHDKAFEKENWTDRLNHFETLDLSDPAIFKDASNPVGMRAALLAYQDTLSGLPTGCTVSLDACSSGLQLLSLLVSCPKSFQLCGGDSTDIVDSYTEIYMAMRLDGSLSRKDVKAAIMTSLYGSTATPKEIFSDNIDIFYDTMEEIAPGAWDLNIGLQELWGEIDSNEYSWTLPDNFHAHIETKKKDYVPFTMFDEKYEAVVKLNERPEFHKGLGPNLIHSVDGMVVREMARRCMFDQDKVNQIIASLDGTGVDGETSEMVRTLWDHYLETNFLSVRILDYLTEDTMGIVDSLVIAKLIQTLPDRPFDIITVHDCFRCHPNSGNDVRLQYNHIMADINDSLLLRSMARQVTGKPVSTRKVGTIDRNAILEANYMIA